MADFKVRVVQNIGRASKEEFGRPGTIHEVKYGTLDGGFANWTNDKFEIHSIEELNIAVGKCPTFNTVFELVEEQNQCMKAALKPCMVVETRDKRFWLVTECKQGISLSACDGNHSLYLKDYDLDLTFSTKQYREYDIVKIYGIATYGICSHQNSTVGRELIWERKEEPETVDMTMNQICEALGKNVRLIKEGE